SGRNVGRRGRVSSPAISLAGFGVPPDSGILTSAPPPPPPASAMTMTPDVPHVPALKLGRLHRTTGSPPFTSIFRNLPSAQYAIQRLSGDQNGLAALSVPGN